MNITLFKNMTSKEPLQTTLERVADLIRHDEKIKSFTASYRQTGSKTFKAECPLFAVACRFEGGKAQDNVCELTGLSLVDFDHIGASPADAAPAIARLRQLVQDDPHTLLAYTTVSGNGLRVIYRYEPPAPDCGTYRDAFYAGNAHYERLTGLKADMQCKNLTRLSGLAHDPSVFLRPEAEALPFTRADMQAAAATHTRQAREDRQQTRIRTYYDTVIAPRLATEGIVYAPGSHNEYVMRTGYLLAAHRYPKAAVLKWACDTFADYADTAQVITSCYAGAHTARQAPDRTSDRQTAGVDEIKAFLSTHVRLRYNTVTGRPEYLPVPPPDADTDTDALPDADLTDTAAPPDAETDSDGGTGQDEWQPVTDRVANSIWAQMSATRRVARQDLFNIIDSDFVPPYNPFAHYLESLPPADGHDYIRELAETVRVKGGEAEQERWLRYLRKWLVAMVAGWLEPDVVNNVILVLIGEQGAYKTTWFNCLLPPPLRRYFYTKTNANRLTKDDLLTLAQYALICFEELETMRPQELNQLKAAVTMPSINERAAYAHFHEHRQHIASFCATGNSPQFLSDPTGNRRWLPFEVERIVSPREHPFRHTGIYAQAYALYRAGFTYWFGKEDIHEQNAHNRQFETPRLETELVDLYFRKPLEHENGEFLSVGRAIQLMSYGISQKLSAVNVGRAFVELGFERVRTSTCRGFIAICRTAEEMKAYQLSILRDTAPDEE